ncbi:MAG: hypothetical protein AAF945_19965 [Actinomycetota bacterium]
MTTETRTTPRTLDALVPDPPFRERHRRRVDAAHEHVATAMLDTTTSDISILPPLMALRTLPARLSGSRQVDLDGPLPLLDAFRSEGFVDLGQTVEPEFASIHMGAIGKFWHPSGNAPVPLDDIDAFLAFDEPGFNRIAFDLVATELDGAVELTTETRVAGTSPDADRRFRPYWWLIRGPSGLIRRQWLAAIDRRASSMAVSGTGR